MKTLSDYTKDVYTKIFADNGAFFAFSNEQLQEKRVDGIKYANLGAGLVCPVDNAKALSVQLKEATQSAIKKDIAENGLVAIIKRELHNHECFYTGDTDDVVDALKGYGVTDDDIQKVYKDEMGSLDVNTL